MPSLAPVKPFTGMTAMNAQSSAHALSISGLSKAYGLHQVLKQLDLEVPRHAVHGLVGLNGSGKTTTLECLLGLRSIDEGDIKILGLPPHYLHKAMGRIVAIFDQPSLNPNLTVRQCLQQAEILTNKVQRSLQEAEELLGIQRYSDFKIKNLSLGNKRRASIAQTLLANPELVILDEPFNGLDAGGVEDILQLIGELNREEGTTFLLSSHQLPYLEKICSHIAILNDGDIAANGSIKELLNNQQLIKLASPKLQDVEEAIRDLASIRIMGREGDYLSLESTDLDSSEINQLLVSQRIPISELVLQKASLENLFHEITGDQRQ